MLLSRGEPRVEGKDDGLFTEPSVQKPAGLADVLLGGHEDQDVPAFPSLDQFIDRAHSRLGRGLVLFPVRLPVGLPVGLPVRPGIQRAIADLDGIEAP